jgi:hypothetical protein
MPKKTFRGAGAKRGRAKEWHPWTPHWLRHPKMTAQLLERNAAYFERKAQHLRKAAESFRQMSARNGLA